MQKLVIISLLALSACQLNIVRGDGEMTTRSEDLSGYDSIVLDAPGKVLIRQRDFEPIDIAGEANILEHITLEVRDGVLFIESEPNVDLWETQPIIYLVAAPVLSEVILDGSGEIANDAAFVAESLDLTLNGSGDMRLELDVQSLRTILRGSGTLSLEGTADDHSIVLSGSGDVEAFDLETRTCSVELTGSGNVDVYAIDQLTAAVFGSGNITFEGNPELLDSIVDGSGRVQAR